MSTSVVIYTPAYFPDYVGGGERLVQLTAAGLRELGVPVTIVTGARGARSYRFDDVDVVGVPHEVQGPHWTQVAPDAEALDAVLRGRGASIVHTVTLAGLEAVGSAALRHGARLGLGAMEYGVICPRRTLVRGDGQLCPGRRSQQDCFACSLEGKRVRDRVLGHAGQVVPARVAAAATSLARRVAGRPFAMQLHAHAVFAAQDEARRAALERLHLLVATTHFTQHVIAPHLKQRTHCEAVMFPLDAALRGAEPKRTPTQLLRVGFVGRALPIKGLDVLIAAATQARSRVPLELRVHCPRNDGEQAEHAAALERALRALPGSEWQWCGVLDAMALRALHAQIDVLVVPSVWPEWLGFVTLEAQGLGTPIVLSDLESQRELADGDRRSSWFVPPGDAAALAACLEEVWAQKQAGTLAAPRIVAPSPAEYAAELLRLYGGVAGR